ncbi:MAG: hypothetical protein V4510_11300 [bacterium]
MKPQLRLEVSPSPPPLAPDGAAGTLTVHWTYEMSPAVTAMAETEGNLQDTTLHFSPAPRCAAYGLLVTGATTIPLVLHSPDPTQMKREGDATFRVQATSDAPGETPVNCTFTAYVDQWGLDNAVDRTDLAIDSEPVIVAYRGAVGATVPSTIAEAGPRKTIDYAIQLNNLGNSRTFVNFNVVDSHSADGWNPVAPSQTSLESKKQGGTQTTAETHFLISTPYKNGWNNKESTFQLKVWPQSTKDPALTGDEITVNILARVRGCYGPTCVAGIPGPEPGLYMVALLAFALASRRRK